MLNFLFNLFIFPGFVFILTLGLLTSWIDRKLTALVQCRVGPPFLQPYYDIRKLFAKEITVPKNASYWIFVGSPVVSMSVVTIVAMILGMALMGMRTFNGDIILLIYLLMIPPIMLILGALSSGNPLSVVGASREIKLLLSYEFVFILSIITVILRTNSVSIGDIINYQNIHGSLLFSLSGFIAFVIMLTVSIAKLGLVPFDIAEAETEIAGGVYMEYSGALLALWRITKTILLAALPMLAIILFFPSQSLLFFLKYLIIVVIFTLVRNTNPRLRIDSILKFFWGYGVPLGLVALFLALLGL